MVKLENKGLRRLGVMGGMFDPVHHGHLRIALECKECLALDELRMIPCAEPAHRGNAKVDGTSRLAMLQCALENIEGIMADDRELRRVGPSYTVDTLRSLRAENSMSAMYLIIGSDAFQALATWHEWREILVLANIVIARRPDHDDDRMSNMGRVLDKHFSENQIDFLESQAGQIFSLNVTQLEISSSSIRQLFYANKTAQFLMPETVLHMIEKNKYYLGCESI